MNGTESADIVVIGGGVIGCSTAYNLVKHGGRRVLLLEQNELCTGGTAKSCAIVRTHYSVPPNLLHAVESLKLFSHFHEQIGGEIGWRRTGYLIVGPEAHQAPMEEVFRLQNEHGIDTAVLTPEEAKLKHPLLSFHDVGVIGYDSQAGYVDPYLTTTAYANRAIALGATIRTGTRVTGIEMAGDLKRVRTSEGAVEAAVVVMAAGPWTHNLIRSLEIDLPYVNSLHKVITLRIDQPYQLNWPIVKDLTTPDKIYFRSEVGGVVLVGTGDHGEPLANPDLAGEAVALEHVERIAALIANRMPTFANPDWTDGWTGIYDITPDWNPLVGPVPGFDGLYVAVGFSGHGFKLAPTIGESLAQTVLGLAPRIPIAPYAVDRFEKGMRLDGAYGIGSIS